MSDDVLEAWIENAKSATGAHMLALRRSRGEKTCSSWPIEEATAADVLAAARADLGQRRMRSGKFNVVVLTADKTELRKRPIEPHVDDEDDEGDRSEDPWRSVAASLQKAVDSLARALVDGTKGPMVEMRLVIDSLSTTITNQEQRYGEMLGTVYGLASLKEEAEKESRKSGERIELGKTIVSELGPIIGAGVTMMAKGADPAVRAMFASLKPEQIGAIADLLDKEQLIAFQAAVEAFENAKRNSAANGAPKEKTDAE